MSCVHDKTLKPCFPKAKVLRCPQIFIGQRRVEHRRIVRIERDIKPSIDQARQWVMFKIGRNMEANIAGQADFERYLPVTEYGNQHRIFQVSDPMTDTHSVQRS